MAELSEIMQAGKEQTTSILEDLAVRMTEVLNKCQNPTSSNDSYMAQFGIKLDDNNYELRSQVVEMYISGKDKLGYINGDLPQPPLTYLAY